MSTRFFLRSCVAVDVVRADLAGADANAAGMHTRGVGRATAGEREEFSSRTTRHDHRACGARPERYGGLWRPRRCEHRGCALRCAHVVPLFRVRSMCAWLLCGAETRCVCRHEDQRQCESKKRTDLDGTGCVRVGAVAARRLCSSRKTARCVCGHGGASRARSMLRVEMKSATLPAPSCSDDASGAALGSSC